MGLSEKLPRASESRTRPVAAPVGTVTVISLDDTLTGFTVEWGSARFTFDAARHDERPQQVLDWRTPAGLDGHRPLYAPLVEGRAVDLAASLRVAAERPALWLIS